MEVKLTFNQPGYPISTIKVLLQKHKDSFNIQNIPAARTFIDSCRTGHQKDRSFYLSEDFALELKAVGFEVTEVPDIWADPFKIYREQDALAQKTLDQGLSSDDIEVVKLQLRALHNLYANKLVSGGFA